MRGMSREGTDPVASEPPEQDGTELLGTVIADRYHLECVLGRGGMGLVYRAAHLGLRRQVAVKLLHPVLAASSEVRNRFDREAFAAGKIDHPNCIQVMDSGKLADGTRYLAMELLDGKPLNQVLERDGQIAPDRALRVLAHVLRGLGHIHAAGLIHRDIKPENVFLIRNGRDNEFAKILDFGIAKGMGASDLDEGVKLTQAGMACGTPIYMAPEQALGNPLDGRADLYAAAILGYEMLCGQPPFYSDDKLDVMAMHTARPVPAMRDRLVEGGYAVAPAIEHLIARGLTKQPSERYATAEEFLAAVEDVVRTGVALATHRNATGSQPLVTTAGDVELGDPSIAIAIEAALATAASEAALATAASDSPDSRDDATVVDVPRTERDDIERAQERTARLVRWPLYATILGVAAAVIAIVALPRHAGDGLDPASPAGAALAGHKHGRFDDALRILRANPDRLAADGDMQLVLGHVLAAMFERRASIEAYAAALALRPELQSDGELRNNLRIAAADRDPAVVATAFDVWVRTADPEARTLVAIAAVSDDLGRRHAVVPVIERHGLGGQVEWWRAYALDLQQDEPCTKRKQAVAKLRGVADPRAVTALESAIDRRAKSNPRYKINGCLADDARAAIGYLNGLANRPP